MNPGDVTGIILAGGHSTRMGTDKAMLHYKGIPLIQRTAGILRPHCSRLVISANTDKYHFTGLETWPDELPVNAAIVGVYSCLRRSETRLNIVLSCDMPLVTTELLGEMLVAADKAPIVIPVHGNGCMEPLCAVYSRSVVESMKLFIDSGRLSLREFVKNTEHIRYKVPGKDKILPVFFNVNSAADYDLLNKS